MERERERESGGEIEKRRECVFARYEGDKNKNIQTFSIINRTTFLSFTNINFVTAINTQIAHTCEKISGGLLKTLIYFNKKCKNIFFFYDNSHLYHNIMQAL